MCSSTQALAQHSSHIGSHLLVRSCHATRALHMLSLSQPESTPHSQCASSSLRVRAAHLPGRAAAACDQAAACACDSERPPGRGGVSEDQGLQHGQVVSAAGLEGAACDKHRMMSSCMGLPACKVKEAYPTRRACCQPGSQQSSRLRTPSRSTWGLATDICHATCMDIGAARAAWLVRIREVLRCSGDCSCHTACGLQCRLYQRHSQGTALHMAESMVYAGGLARQTGSSVQSSAPSGCLASGCHGEPWWAAL